MPLLLLNELEMSITKRDNNNATCFHSNRLLFLLIVWKGLCVYVVIQHLSQQQIQCVIISGVFPF